jgi:hypothetical protein
MAILPQVSIKEEDGLASSASLDLNNPLLLLEIK